MQAICNWNYHGESRNLEILKANCVFVTKSGIYTAKTTNLENVSFNSGVWCSLENIPYRHKYNEFTAFFYILKTVGDRKILTIIIFAIISNHNYNGIFAISDDCGFRYVLGVAVSLLFAFVSCNRKPNCVLFRFWVICLSKHSNQFVRFEDVVVFFAIGYIRIWRHFDIGICLCV